MANKIWPNTTSKVPAQYLAAMTDALGWRAEDGPRMPGALKTEGIWYDLGNVGAGFDNNGDLIPDRNAWMQPVGDPSLFDATALRLVKCYGLVIVKLNDGTEQLIPFEDRLYFEHIPASNTGAVGFVYYEFMPLRSGVSATLSPYQEVASGYNNEKFNGDYGASISTGTAPIPSVSIDKQATATVALGGQITYTMLVTNTSGTIAFGDPDVGMPATVSDALPANTTYVDNSAGASGLQNGNTVLIRYSTDHGATWSATKPSPVTAVTNLSWVFAKSLQPNETATVTFQATVSGSYSGLSVSNTAGFGLDNLTPLVTDTASTHLTGSRTISGTVFADTGSGANFGNGVMDSGETTGIGSIGVSLYVDINNNDVFDVGTDVFWGSVNSTAVTGAFTFTTLPAAKYVVVVNPTDSDLTTGYSLTSSVSLPADVTSADATGKNFGFAPALAVDKTLIGTSPVYEGDNVIYKIAVTNRRSGSGGGSSSQTRMTWSNSISTGTHTGNQFLNAENAAGAGRSEGGTLYATAPLTGNSEYVTCTGWDIDTPPSGAITKVEIVLDSNYTGDVTSSTIEADVVTVSTGNTIRSGPAVYSETISTLPNGLRYIDVTSWKTWNWADFSGSTYGVYIVAKKQGKPSGKFYLYATGLRITSTVTGSANADNTLSPVPLTDTYDADLLQFVSANPAQASVTVTGTAPNQVGTITWTDVGPIVPGVTKDVTVKFRALEPPGNTPLTGVRNTATVNQATYQNGIDAGDDDGYVDVTLNPTGTIGDYVWRDTDGGRDQDPTEPGIPNVTVFLDDNSNAALDWTDSNGNGVWDTGEGERWVVTDSTGHYLFTGLRTNGSYNVRVLTTTLPGGGGTNTYDEDGNYDSMRVVALTNLGNYLTADFGYQATNESVTGTVWHDLNRNGASTPGTGEPGLANVTVTLYNSSNAVVATTTTNSSGQFSFSGDYTGVNYYVVVTTTTGDMSSGTWTQSYDTSGLGTANRVDFSLSAGGSAQADFSYYQTGTYSIGDTVFYNWNNNTTKDTGEMGIPGVTVRLYTTAGVLLATTTTDSAGVYAFTDRANGSYTVVVDEAAIPTGFTQTNHSGTSGVTAVTLSGASNNDVDFGYRGASATSSIGDYVYYDSNDNGTQDSGEPGIAGVTVELYWDSNGDGTPDGLAIASTVTADGSNVNYPKGSYQFSNLPPSPTGWYYVVKVIPLSTMTTQTADPDRDGEPRSNTTLTLTVPFDNMDTRILLGMASYTGADFGYLATGVIGDRVWLDQDADGVQDSGEAGIAGVTVTAVQGGTTVTATTDNDGYYNFAGLSNGIWTVSLPTANFNSGGPLANHVATYDRDGGLDISTAVTLTTGTISSPGTDPLAIDFGLKLNGSYSISGGVCIHDARILGLCDDVDNFADDGVDLDVGTDDETELAGLTVYLYTDTGTYLGMATTDAGGTYSFTGLPNGNYKVVLDSTPSPLNHATLHIPATLPAGVTAITPYPVESPVNYTNPTTVASSVTIASANITHVDYAFGSTVDYDFGDLPSSYEATTWANDGARHIIPTGGATIYLGSAKPDAEANGQPTATATGDDLNGSTPDDEDGVTVHRISAWADGAASDPTSGVTGGWVQVTIPNGVTGYLCGWIDWNHNNSLIDVISGTSEMIISQAITGTGSPQTIAFAIPAGIIGATDESWLARFRIFTEEPDYALYSYKGEASNGEVEDYQFQRFVNGAIGDRVWVDADHDGVQDAGETGLGGVLVTLSGAASGTQYTSDGTQDVDGDGVIDPVGYYRFKGLANGSYTVTITVPTGYTSSYDEDTGTTSPDGVTTVSGSAQHLTADFGLNPQLANISGAVYYDANHDNLFGGDTPVATVEVQLWTDPNNDGNPADGLQVAGAYTNAAGAYTFTNVPSGHYVVVEIDPNGAISDLDTDNPTPPGTASDNRIRVDLKGTDIPNNNFLDDGLTLASISGFVYDDGGFGVAGNDAFGGTPADVPVMQVPIRLYLDLNGNGLAEAAELMETTVTGASGAYSFTNLPAGSYLVVEMDNAATDVTDADGTANTADKIAVTLAGSNITDRNFLDDGTPVYTVSGTVYNDKDNSGTFGGDTPISGVTVQLVADTNNDGTVDAGDSVVATHTTGGVGTYSFTNIPNGNYLLVETDPDGYTSVTDKDGIGNGASLIDVTVSSANNTGNDFLDHTACSNTWAKWLTDHPSAGGASGNPDGDRYDNLTEYAFNQPYDNGAGNAWWIQPGTGDTLDGIFVRPRGALQNVTYTLQAATTLGSPTTWVDIVIPPDMITIVYNNNCTETVTFHNLETLTGGKPFVRVKAVLDDPATTVYTEVEGWKETTLASCRTYNNPFLRETAFTGTVSSVSGQVLTFANSLGTLNLAPGSSYYLEVTSTGGSEGHRFDIASAGVDGNGKTQVTLVPDSDVYDGTPPFNTLETVPDNLVGASVVIRTHWTLGELFPVSGFHAAADMPDADQVQVSVKGVWTYYWLKNTTPSTWVVFPNNSSNQASTVIPPGQGVFVKNNSSAKMLAYGEVRANAFIRPLYTGYNLVGGGYPLVQSANDTGGRAMSKTPAGFFGSLDFKTADSFFIWKGDATPNANGYDTYYLLDRPLKVPPQLWWVQAGDTGLVSKNSDALFQGDAGVFIRVKTSLHGYTIPCPWTP